MARHIVLKAANGSPQSAKERLRQGRLHKLTLDRFETESGDSIANLRIAYRVFGRPNATRDNIVLVFHALTGDANCAGYEDKDGHVPGWWEGLFDPKSGLDLNELCVICPNHPMSCYGSSGPADHAVGDCHPLGPDFPDLSARDLVRAHAELVQTLGFTRLRAVLGGSLGGMLAMEWAIMRPVEVERVGVIAAPAAGSAQSIAFNHIQRKCFEMDPAFNGGHYYEGPRPVLALSLARQIGMITYRTPAEFDTRFGRKQTLRETQPQNYFEIQRYLDYQGEKFIQRFDANSYIKLTGVLSSHDITRERGSLEQALSSIRARCLFVGIDSDILYTPAEVKALHDACVGCGVDAAHRTITSLNGHDSFLINYEQLNPILRDFVQPQTASGESP